MSDDRSNRQIIIDGLNSLPGYKKQASNGWYMVRCPFHDDNQPSCGVRVAEPALGVYNCLACEAKGGWNKFAEKTGLEQIKAWNTGESVDADAVVSQGLDDQLLGDTGTTFGQVLKTFGAREAVQWPERIDWRGFPGWFLRALGAHAVGDWHKDSIAVLFPVKVAGRVRGGVKAVFVKEKGKKRSLSYITSRGSWIAEYGLFPYVYARSLIRKNNIPFVVMVEGPRDAMRLCLNGIPAVAVLGAKNITDRKILFVTALNVDAIYVMADPDEAGQMMNKRVKAMAKTVGIPSHKITLPETNDDGEKMDPGNMPKKILKRLMKAFRDKHGFEIPDTIY